MKFTSAVVLSAATAVSATFGPGWDNKVSSYGGALIPTTFSTLCTTTTSVAPVPVVVASSWSYTAESKTWAYSEAPKPTTYTVSTSAAPVVTYAPAANTSVPIVKPTLSYSTTAAPAFTGAASSKSWSVAAGVVAMLGFVAI